MHRACVPIFLQPYWKPLHAHVGIPSNLRYIEKAKKTIKFLTYRRTPSLISSHLPSPRSPCPCPCPCPFPKPARALSGPDAGARVGGSGRVDHIRSRLVSLGGQDGVYRVSGCVFMRGREMEVLKGRLPACGCWRVGAGPVWLCK